MGTILWLSVSIDLIYRENSEDKAVISKEVTVAPLAREEDIWYFVVYMMTLSEVDVLRLIIANRTIWLTCKSQKCAVMLRLICGVS